MQHDAKMTRPTLNTSRNKGIGGEVLRNEVIDDMWHSMASCYALTTFVLGAPLFLGEVVLADRNLLISISIDSASLSSSTSISVTPLAAISLEAASIESLSVGPSLFNRGFMYEDVKSPTRVESESVGFWYPSSSRCFSFSALSSSTAGLAIASTDSNALRTLLSSRPQSPSRRTWWAAVSHWVCATSRCLSALVNMASPVGVEKERAILGSVGRLWVEVGVIFRLLKDDGTL